MIVGIGVDSVDINRFEQWHTFSQRRLERIFSDQEIQYCLAVPHKSAERFAVRFAAREAFFKAWSSYSHHKIPFLSLCKKIKVTHAPITGAALLQIDDTINSILTGVCIEAFLSLTHTHSVATAFVLLRVRSD